MTITNAAVLSTQNLAPSLENEPGLWYGLPGIDRRSALSFGARMLRGTQPAGQSRRRGPPPSGPTRYSARRRPRVLTLKEGGQSFQVMLGILRGPQHLEVVRRLRFYHVPVSAIAAARTAVAYAAFYEGAARFGRDTGMIRFYAPVLAVSRVRRAELPGLTWPGRGGPDTPYYRFDLGPIETLPRAITNPDRLRVGFRFPAIERLRRAETLKELGRGSGGTERPRRGKGEQR
jgi:hypothetical protein